MTKVPKVFGLFGRTKATKHVHSKHARSCTDRTDPGSESDSGDEAQVLAALELSLSDHQVSEDVDYVERLSHRVERFDDDPSQSERHEPRWSVHSLTQEDQQTLISAVVEEAAVHRQSQCQRSSFADVIDAIMNDDETSTEGEELSSTVRVMSQRHRNSLIVAIDAIVNDEDSERQTSRWSLHSLSEKDQCVLIEAVAEEAVEEIAEKKLGEAAESCAHRDIEVQSDAKEDAQAKLEDWQATLLPGDLERLHKLYDLGALASTDSIERHSRYIHAVSRVSHSTAPLSATRNKGRQRGQGASAQQVRLATKQEPQRPRRANSREVAVLWSKYERGIVRKNDR